MENKENNDLLSIIQARIRKLQGAKQSLVDNLGTVCPRCGSPVGGSNCDTCG